MSQTNRKRRRALLALLLLLGLGYAGYRAFGTNPVDKVLEMRKELAAKDLTPEQRRAAAERFRAALGELSEEDRRAAGKAMSAERNKRFAEDLARYARLSALEKARYLDDQIKRSEDRKRQAQAGQGAGGPAARGGAAPGSSSATNGSDRTPPTKEERDHWRKQRLDDTTPEFRADLDQYRKDMQARRQQWGLPPAPTRGR
jgi:hypothetical protein